MTTALIIAVELALQVAATAHIVTHKRDVRSAIAWVGIVWLAPAVGLIVYVLLGINRIKRRAAGFRQDRPYPRVRNNQTPSPRAAPLPDTARHLAPLAVLMNQVTGLPLTPGNTVEPLVDGDECYPAMLAAIDAAEHSIALSTYIFDRDPAGETFADALGRAVKRGVSVCVLLDGLGSLYSIPTMVGPLKARGVTVATFLRSFYPWRMPYLNLRNHRKLLVVDGRVGFTGGINIRQGHLLLAQPRHPVRDTHFRVTGPVIADLMDAFNQDWAFTTGEALQGDRWYPTLDGDGPVVARGISSGPDEEVELVAAGKLAAISQARRRIRVVTPYFLPDVVMIAGLRQAARRGVEVDIVIPELNNLRLVQWAMMAQVREVMEGGCRFWLSPPPFDHSKLMTVDDVWTLVGSANWDARSLRLNFEFNMECFDPGLTAAADAIVDRKIGEARELTFAEVDSRPAAVKIRDGVVRLLSPYL